MDDDPQVVWPKEMIDRDAYERLRAEAERLREALGSIQATLIDVAEADDRERIRLAAAFAPIRKPEKTR